MIFLIIINIFASYTTEVQYTPDKNRANWCNLLRVDINMNIYKSTNTWGEFSASGISIYKINKDRIINDYLTFSNIEEDNTPFELAICGYTQHIGKGEIFAGVRNVNEDYFVSDATSFFTNSSSGIFPVLSANYEIANYPLSGLCIHYKQSLNRFNLTNSIYYKPKTKNIYTLSELNYNHNSTNAFIGISYNNIYDGDRRGSIAWWGYIEQRLFDKDNLNIDLLAQYGGNSYKDIFCKSYLGIGSVFTFAHSKYEHKMGVIYTKGWFNNGNETDIR